MYVYALVNPDNIQPFYVGKAIDPHARLAKHLRDARIDSKVPVKSHIKRLMLDGKKPQMVLLEVTTFDAVDEAERRWVLHFHSNFDGVKNVLLVAHGSEER